MYLIDVSKCLKKILRIASSLVQEVCKRINPINETSGLGCYSAKLYSSEFLKKYEAYQGKRFVLKTSTDRDLLLKAEDSLLHLPTVSVEFSPGCLSFMLHFLRSRLNSNVCFFVEHVNGKNYIGIRAKISETLPIHLLSPDVGEENGFAKPSSVSVKLFDQHEVSYSWWKKNDRNFGMIRYDRFFKNLFPTENSVLRPEIGIGLFTEREKGERLLSPSLLDPEKLKKGVFLHGGFNLEKRPFPFIFVENKLRVIVGWSNPETGEILKTKNILFVAETLSQSNAKIPQGFSTIKSKIPNTNENISLMDEKGLGTINQKLKTVNTKLSDLEKTVEVKNSTVQQQVASVSTLVEKQLESFLAQFITKLDESLSFSKIPDNKLEKSNLLKNAEIAHALNAVLAFETSQHLLQGVALGLGSGLLHILLSDGYINTKNAPFKILFRLARRTISCSYPVAISIMGVNCLHNYLDNKPLIQQWGFLDWTRVSAIIPPILKQECNPKWDKFLLEAYNWGFLLWSLWESRTIGSIIVAQPLYPIKIGIGFFIYSKISKWYFQWVEQNPEASAQLRLIDQEDFFWITAMLKAPACLCDFVSQKVFSEKAVSENAFDPINKKTSNLSWNEFKGFLFSPHNLQEIHGGDFSYLSRDIIDVDFVEVND